MDLQVVSSLSTIPMVSIPFAKLVAIYSDIKKTYPLANSVLTVVEKQAVKAQTVAAPYLEKYQPQIGKVDNFANERVVKRLIDMCGPVAKKTPEQLKECTKKRVVDAVEAVRSRAAQTRAQIAAAPAAGRDLVVAKYQGAVELASEKASLIRSRVPTLPTQMPTIPNAREYIDQLLAQYRIQERYNAMWQIAASTRQRVHDAASNFVKHIPRQPSDIIVPVRTHVEAYVKATSERINAAKERVHQSYEWMQKTRLEAIATARGIIDNTVGAVWEYGTDLKKEILENYKKPDELLLVAVRRIRSGRDAAVNLVRWSYHEALAIRAKGQSILDSILSSWLFQWLTLQPIIKRLRPAPEPGDDFEEYEGEDE